MKKTMGILATVVAIATSQSIYATSEKIGNSVQESVENVSPMFHNEPKERDLPALNYVNQPPMVPHAVKNYQVTKNVNQCLTFHSPEAYRVTGATRISPTHFMDRDDNIVGSTSPLRYFCLQCHISQSDVEPIVPNEFKPMAGFGK